MVSKMLLEPMVFNIFKKSLLNHLTTDISKIDISKTNGVGNIVFGNVVEPFVLATLVSNLV